MSYTASRPSGLPVSTAVASRQSALAWGYPAICMCRAMACSAEQAALPPRILVRCDAGILAVLVLLPVPLDAGKCPVPSHSRAMRCPRCRFLLIFFDYLDACSIHSDAVRRPIGGVSISIHCSPLPRHAAERGQLTLTRVCDDLPRQPRVRR